MKTNQVKNNNFHCLACVVFEPMKYPDQTCLNVAITNFVKILLLSFGCLSFILFWKLNLTTFLIKLVIQHEIYYWPNGWKIKYLLLERVLFQTETSKSFRLKGKLQPKKWVGNNVLSKPNATQLNSTLI